ncbi:MAG: GNAT family protein [Ferruginibacter sp.]
MIRLEYFDKTDFQQLMMWVKDDELLKNWCGSLFSFPLTEMSLNWYIEGSNHAGAEVFIYKVVETSTNTTIGHISLGGISKKNKSARISRVLVSNDKRGKGYCIMMVSEILKIGFEDLKLHRISLGVYDFNASAIRCYQKAGMIIEGTNRDILNFKGKWWSLVELSILENEWRSPVIKKSN